jgi:hypothetical protein
MGIEPMTSSLPRKCSTAELSRLFSLNVEQLILAAEQLTETLTQLERKTRFELATYSLEGYRSTN